MQDHWLSRERLLIGEDGIKQLANSTVCVLGLGGVGGSAAEALCRAGIGHLILVDHDTVDVTNLNRQLFATRQTIGQRKIDAAMDRLRSINPSVTLTLLDTFYLPENREEVFSHTPDFMIDAIDTVTAKLDLAEQCAERGIPLISCLGTGNRFDPSKLTIGKIEDTAGCGCPLARVIRRECKKRDIHQLPVVFSKEYPTQGICSEDSPSGRHSPGSISFVPPVAGYLLASYVVRFLLSSLDQSKGSLME